MSSYKLKECNPCEMPFNSSTRRIRMCWRLTTWLRPTTPTITHAWGHDRRPPNKSWRSSPTPSRRDPMMASRSTRMNSSTTTRMSMPPSPTKKKNTSSMYCEWRIPIGCHIHLGHHFGRWLCLSTASGSVGSYSFREDQTKNCHQGRRR